MAEFILNSIIEIGEFRFTGDTEVRIDRTVHSYMDRAVITIPSAGVRQFGKLEDGEVKLLPIPPDAVTTRNLFNDGDKVTIQLGFNGDLREEFRGFVKRRGTGTPLVVECEGYSWELRNKATDISADYRTKHTSAKELLQLATKGTHITVQCPVDFEITGIKLVKFNGQQICDIIKQVSDNTLSIFFIQPDVLWCGLLMTAYAANAEVNTWGFPTVDYQIGYNTIRDRGLTEKLPSEPVQVIFKGKYATGALLYNESREKAAKNKYTHLSSQIATAGVMGHFAQEKAYFLNYTGYQGKVHAFLQPFALPGYDAYIVNTECPELTGKYLIESTEVHFGVGGGWRFCSIGPRVGFDSN